MAPRRRAISVAACITGGRSATSAPSSGRSRPPPTTGNRLIVSPAHARSPSMRRCKLHGMPPAMRWRRRSSGPFSGLGFSSTERTIRTKNRWNRKHFYRKTPLCKRFLSFVIRLEAAAGPRRALLQLLHHLPGHEPLEGPITWPPSP